jgi:hypothetical protein
MREVTLNTYEQELANAAKRLGLNGSAFSRCEPAKANDVARTARERFVTGNPRVWWLGFRKPYETVPYGSREDLTRSLNVAIPSGSARCWLIAESESEIYPVFEGEIVAIVSVLKECGFFEYYLVDSEFRWIVADTDHNELLVARSIVQ